MLADVALQSLAFIATALLGVFVFTRRPARPANRAFFIFAASVAWWVYCNAMIITASDEVNAALWIRIAFAAAALVPSCLLAFSLQFPLGRPPLPVTTWLLLYAVGLAAAALCLWGGLVTAVKRQEWGYEAVYNPWLLAFFAAYFTIGCGASAEDLRRRLGRSAGLQRLQIQYFLLGTALSAALAAALSLVVPLAFGTARFSIYAPSAAVVMISIITYSMARHRLMDVEFAIRRGVAYAVTVAVITGVFLIVVPVLERWLREQVGYASVAASFVAAICIAVVFQPLRNRIQLLVDRLFRRQAYDYHRTLRDASQMLAHSLDLDLLLRHLLAMVNETMAVKGMALMLYDPVAESYVAWRPEREAPGDNGSPPSIPAGASLLVRHLRDSPEPLLRDEVEHHWTRPDAAAMVAEMRQVDAQVIVPLLVEERLVGMLCLGEKWSERVYTAQDVALLSTVANQAAVAVQNARLYEEVVWVKEYNENILAHMDSGVIAVDVGGRITTINHAAQRMLGVRAEALVGRPAAALEGGLDEALGLSSPVPRSNQEVTLQIGGRAVPIVAGSSPLRGPDGEVLGTVAVFSDLSRIKELEAEKNRASRLAAVGALAAGMAHEIKNPLVSIRTFAELLPERYEDPDFRDRFAALAIGEIDRIDGLVADLLELVRTGPRRFAAVSMHELLQQALALLASQLAAARVHVARHYTRHLPYIWGDPDRLKQAILNLLLNAMQAMPGGGTLRVTTSANGRPGPDGRPRVCVEIANGGEPIPPEHLERIFDPFFTTKTRGTGLGLAVSHKIIEEHQGAVTVVSNREQGTVFTVLLPVANSRAVGAPTQA
jgi:PAS domain S-box-containing protein